jgi:prepilin-type processing-associated H-X9-DG protein
MKPVHGDNRFSTQPAAVTLSPCNGERAGRGVASDRGAFTLVELLAMIGMVALGALMLAPALARTKSNSPAIQCLNNLEQLQRALAMYAADNNGMLPWNPGRFSEGWTNWCCGILNWQAGFDNGPQGETVPANINTNDLLKSALGPYTGSRTSVYKCPADKVPSDMGPRVRSVSMNGFVGGLAMGNDPKNGVYGYTQYRIYLKDSDFIIPGPSTLWVFLDEHPDSINDWLFAMDMASSTAWPTYTTWDDVPASYHNGACGFSFADGHVEIKKWLDQNSVWPVAKTDGCAGVGTVSIHDNVWMAARTTAPK